MKLSGHLMSDIYGGQIEELTGKSEMQCKLGYSINVFCLVEIYSGPSGVHIWALIAGIVLVVEERVQTFCSAVASIALMKNTTLVIQKVPNRS